jgi:hypothetical protein
VHHTRIPFRHFWLPGSDLYKILWIEAVKRQVCRSGDREAASSSNLNRRLSLSDGPLVMCTSIVRIESSLNISLKSHESGLMMCREASLTLAGRSQTSRFHWRRPGHSMSSLQLLFTLKDSCPRIVLHQWCVLDGCQVTSCMQSSVVRGSVQSRSAEAEAPSSPLLLMINLLRCVSQGWLAYVASWGF